MGYGEEHTCANCGKRFTVTDPDWSDAAALAESRETFGFIPSPVETATLCDACWEEFLPWAREQGLTVD